MKPALIALLATVAAWLLMRRSDAVESAEGEASQEVADDFEIPNVFNQLQDMIQPTDEGQAERNRAAFLMTIRRAEGTAGPNGYRTMFGGRLFDSWADHPRIAHSFTNGAGQKLWTSAAGAYQFMAVSPIPGGTSTKVNTWDRLQARLGLADFSPANQDAAALELIREAGALADVEAGRFDQAVNKVRRIWASMPGAGYAQPEKSLDALRVAYIDAGGYLA